MRVLRWTVVVIGVAASGCGDKSPVGGPVQPGTTVHSVLVAPDSATLTAGATKPIAASVVADAGVVDRSVIWTTSDTVVASVSANGMVTAGNTLGRAFVIATSKADPTVKGAAGIIVVAGPAPAVSAQALRNP